MRQAITTKFFGPTNSNGSRIKAKAEAGSLIVHWDYSLNVDQNHDTAAKALAVKLGWDGAWFGGSTATGNVYVWSATGVDESFRV